MACPPDILRTIGRVLCLETRCLGRQILGQVGPKIHVAADSDDTRDQGDSGTFHMFVSWLGLQCCAGVLA